MVRRVVCDQKKSLNSIRLVLYCLELAYLLGDWRGG
jgi:hypothetical protein